MGFIDFILNLAGLLLWFNWRMAALNPLASSASGTLASTLKRKGSSRLSEWMSRLALVGLLFGRGAFYWLLGPAVAWAGSVDFGPITLFFRTDQFWLASLCSLLSFAHVLVLAYFWLLALCIVNRRVATPDLITRLIRLQLGRVARWPLGLQALLPLLVTVAVWPGVHALLSQAELAKPLPAFGPLMIQGGLIALASFFSLKYLIPPVLFADLLASYVYFGRNPVWEFMNTTARNILAPLRRLPLRAGKVDFAPLVGLGLALLLLHWLPRVVLAELDRRKLHFWPQ